ncbi:MAG TPA: hypothetical protein VFV38_02280 [Ktedonobacteraceae bacterium]|nr:hypothetical protein [Ktedonobacteraceae bacterium]
MNKLDDLADLIKEKNEVDAKIANIVGRPAQVGHAGEFIASVLFDIQLHHSATHKSSDGIFQSGPLTGRDVDIKWYLKHEGLLDLNPTAPPDYYLVLAGPKAGAISSRGSVRPWKIEFVFLFDAQQLLAALRPRGVKLGIATSVVSEFWVKAEIYPTQRNHMLMLSDEQKQQLTRFR